jgi:hypothetical protein
MEPSLFATELHTALAAHLSIFDEGCTGASLVPLWILAIGPYLRMCSLIPYLYRFVVSMLLCKVFIIPHSVTHPLKTCKKYDRRWIPTYPI